MRLETVNGSEPLEFMLATINAFYSRRYFGRSRLTHIVLRKALKVYAATRLSDRVTVVWRSLEELARRALHSDPLNRVTSEIEDRYVTILLSMLKICCEAMQEHSPQVG